MKKEATFNKQIKSFDIDKEIEVISTFLKDVPRDSKQLHELMTQMKSLRKQDDFKQIEHWHTCLKFFQAFSSDVAINSERVKRISTHIRKEAKDLPYEWKKLIETDDLWNFDW